MKNILEKSESKKIFFKKTRRNGDGKESENVLWAGQKEKKMKIKNDLKQTKLNINRLKE